MQEITLPLPVSPLRSTASTGCKARQLIEEFCLRQDLSTFDPYDIWKTDLGFRVKNYFNHHPRSGLVPAAALTVFDLWINNRTRLFYKQQEIPIVRAAAALTLLHLYAVTADPLLAETAAGHIDWCLQNSCPGYSGLCWGLNFRNAVSKHLVYERNVPYSTMTPYVLEAMVRFQNVTGRSDYSSGIRSTFRFFDQDLIAMRETDQVLATSYCPFADRIVVNSSSYTMYSFALCLPWLGPKDRGRVSLKTQKLHAFVLEQQQADGSWLYSPEGKSFIDCFHSCIVLKNLWKTGALVPLPGTDSAVQRGYQYLKSAFFCPKEFLFRRFAVANKPGVIRFDLYDNAEALNLAVLLGDSAFAQQLQESIFRRFVRGTAVYSQIDLTGQLRNKNTLRWAVMPFLHALAAQQQS